MDENGLDGLNASWVAWLQAMARHVPGGESRQFGSIPSTSIGVPMPLFNQAFVFDEPDPGDMWRAPSGGAPKPSTVAAVDDRRSLDAVVHGIGRR